MPKNLEISSHKGPYTVQYYPNARESVEAALLDECHIIADERVLELYSDSISDIVENDRLIKVEATEGAKTIDEIIPIMESLIKNGFRRDQCIVAIGGGVIQDITCFLASVMMRGVAWRYVPTTLLAQADSCIGSKSSVNLKIGKNTLGTFYPPEKIFVSTDFLKTLPEDEIRSGIGEMIKVHAIDGKESYDYLNGNFSHLETDESVMEEFITRSLEIKKRYIEIDEFDQGPRNIFNFGHSFGHAIETATNYAVPHGIAVTLGMAIAVDFAVEFGHTPDVNRDRMRPICLANAKDYLSADIDPNLVFQAMARDKKNTRDGYRIIIPIGENAEITAVSVKPDDRFLKTLTTALASFRGKQGRDIR